MSTHKQPLQRTIVFACIIFTLLLCTILGLSTYINNTNVLYKRYEAYITDLLQYVSYNINVDDLENCLKTGVKSKHYNDLQVLFDIIKDTHDIHFLYVIIPLNTSDNDNVQNVIAGMSTYEKKHIPENEVFLGELTGNSYPVEAVTKYYNAINNTGKITFFEEVAEWGTDYTGVMPLINSQGKFFAELCIDVSVNDIHKIVSLHILKNILLTIIICIIFTLLFIYWSSKTVIQPIKRLEECVVDFAKKSHIQRDIEELTINVPDIQTDNEVKSLAVAVTKMSNDIKDYVSNIIKVEYQVKQMSELANKDALTGIRNKTAYDKEVQKLKKELQNGELKFGIVVADLNFLKHINDTFGHDKGNVAIKKLCHLICNIFAHSPVFRIGGDEFAIILKDMDYENIENLRLQFYNEIDTLAADSHLEYWEKISAALGYAIFNKEIDTGYESVFIRADQEMYKQKKNMKAERQD